MKNINTPLLIVMLTHNDYTVADAASVFEQCKDTPVQCWGMKEKPLSHEHMKELFAHMRKCGKTTALEVVGYDEESGMEGARLAAECGVDFLMGTRFFPSVAAFCNDYGIKYYPFVGTIDGRPSVLSGDIDSIVEEARKAVAGGADGIDLLAYRYVGDADALIKAVVEGVDAPVCIAGSIDSHDRLRKVKESGAALFTCGSALFEGKFGNDMPSQLSHLLA